MWNFVWADNKAQSALSSKTKLHTTKYTTKVQYLPIYREPKSHNLLLHNGTVASADGRKSTFKKIILRAAVTEPQSAVRGARWSYRGPFSRRAVRATKIKFFLHRATRGANKQLNVCSVWL